MERIVFTDILQSGSSREEQARQIADRIRSARGYKWVGLYEVDPSEIGLLQCAGRSEPAFTRFPRDKGLNGRAVTRGETVLVNDTSKDEDYLLTFINTQSEIIVPVWAADGKNILGTIDAEGEVVNAFTAEDARFLEDCAQAIRPLWERTDKQ